MNGCPEGSDSRFGAWISVLNRAAQMYFTRVLAPHSIGPGQQAYLLVIQPGESVSQLTIGERLSMDKANVARGVQALERAGYLKRSRPADDRRRWDVRLTKEGARMRERVEKYMRDWVEAIRSDIPSEDWESFVTTLSTIAARAKEHATNV